MPFEIGSELSLADAAAFLRSDPAKNKEPAASAHDANDNEDGGEEAGDISDQGANEGAHDDADTDLDDAEDDGDDEGEQDAPTDEGDAEEGDGDQGDALPLIEAPSSWSTEEKAEWAGLSRKAQEVIQRREQDSVRALRTAQNDAAEQRKTADAEVTRLKGLATHIDALVQRDVADLAKAFPEIKTEADVAALAQSDPARFAAFQGRLMALNAANQARANAAAEVAKADDVKRTEQLTQAKTALLEAFPAWKDPDVARREVTEIQDYAIKQGASEATARANLDPVIYKLAQKAMLHDRAQAARAQAINRTPPRVVKPGQSSNPKATAKEEVRRAQEAKLSQTGDIQDAVALMFR